MTEEKLAEFEALAAVQPKYWCPSVSAMSHYFNGMTEDERGAYVRAEDVQALLSSVPALVAEVRRLREENEQLRAEAIESRANAIQAEAVFDEAARRLEAERDEARRIARELFYRPHAVDDVRGPDWLVKP